MRILTGVFLLLCLTTFVFGQDTSARKTDSATQAKSFIIRDPAEITNDECIFIVDDKAAIKSTSKHILKKINPSDILEIQVLKDSALDRTSSAAFHGPAVIITTKQFAISQYQKKLCAFSVEYKKYVMTEHGDYGILYTFINDKGELKFLRNEDDRIRRLYELPENKIKSVTFSIKETCCGVNRFCIIAVPL